MHTKFLVGKSGGKRPVGRPALLWEDNNRMDLGETRGKVWTVFILLRIGTSRGP
jgi:hypothetical protein